MRTIGVAVAVLLVAAVPGAAAELVGQVEITARGRQARGTDPDEAVVWFTPTAARPPVAPSATPLEVVTAGKQFRPRVLVVPVGSEVRFPNLDPILHNVFSLSPGNEFDLGLYGRGDGESARFERPGVVRVYCNVHQTMAATVVVLDTPYWARPAADGSFRLAGLPPGPGTLTVWHERAEPWSEEVEAGAAAPPRRVRLEVTRPRVPLHTRKDGERYPDPY